MRLDMRLQLADIALQSCHEALRAMQIPQHLGLRRLQAQYVLLGRLRPQLKSEE